MNRLVLIIIQLLISYICVSQNTTKVDLITQTDEVIENISFFNLSQEMMHYEIEYSDSVRLDFETTSDDIYNLWFDNGKSKYRTQLFLGEGEMKIFLNIEDKKLNIKSVSGSEVYYEHKRYSNGLSSISSLSDSLYNLYHKEYFLKNSESVLSLNILENYISKNQNSKSILHWIKTKMESQNENIKNHFLYEGTYERTLSLLNIRSIDISNFNFYDTKGSLKSINSKNNEVTILDFWFVNCPPCINDHKKLVNITKDWEMHSAKPRLIGISNDQDAKVWNNYLSKSAIGWENYRVDLEQKSNLVKHLNISTFPTYVVINKEYKILLNTNSLEDVISYVNAIEVKE